MRLIDADNVLEKISKMIDYCEKDTSVNGLTALFQVGDAIMDCKTIDAELVKRGKWFKTQRKNIWGESTAVLECSACGKYTVGNKGITIKSRYCPNCGAFMREDDNGKE